jgi:hypothetical protein
VSGGAAPCVRGYRSGRKQPGKWWPNVDSIPPAISEARSGAEVKPSRARLFRRLVDLHLWDELDGIVRMVRMPDRFSQDLVNLLNELRVSPGEELLVKATRSREETNPENTIRTLHPTGPRGFAAVAAQSKDTAAAPRVAAWLRSEADSNVDGRPPTKERCSSEACVQMAIRSLSYAIQPPVPDPLQTHKSSRWTAFHNRVQSGQIGMSKRLLEVARLSQEACILDTVAGYIVIANGSISCAASLPRALVCFTGIGLDPLHGTTKTGAVSRNLLYENIFYAIYQHHDRVASKATQKTQFRTSM